MTSQLPGSSRWQLLAKLISLPNVTRIYTYRLQYCLLYQLPGECCLRLAFLIINWSLISGSCVSWKFILANVYKGCLLYYAFQVSQISYQIQVTQSNATFVRSHTRSCHQSCIKYSSAKFSNPIINLNGPYRRMVQNNQPSRKIRALNEVNARLRGSLIN